jgi:hypothetical protein
MKNGKSDKQLDGNQSRIPNMPAAALRILRCVLIACLLPSVLLFWIGTDEIKYFAIRAAIPYLIGIALIWLLERTE